MVDVVHAKKEDLDDVFKILQAANRMLIKQGMNHWRGFYKKKKVLRNIIDNSVFLIKQNGKPVGTFTLSHEEPLVYREKLLNFIKKPKDNPIYLSALAVLPSEQGRSYGKRAMEFVENYARNNGHGSVVFDFLSSYKKLNNFYRKLGYRKIGKISGKRNAGNIYYKQI